MKGIIKKLFALVLALSFVLSGTIVNAKASSDEYPIMVVFPSSFSLMFEVEVDEGYVWDGEYGGYVVEKGEDFRFKVHYNDDATSYPTDFVSFTYSDSSKKPLAQKDGWYVVENVQEYTLIGYTEVFYDEEKCYVSFSEDQGLMFYIDMEKDYPYDNLYGGYVVNKGDDVKFKLSYTEHSEGTITLFVDGKELRLQDGYYVIENVQDDIKVHPEYHYFKEGWNFDGNSWVYFEDDMLKRNEWANINNKWYYFNDSCIIEANEWIKTNNKWYYVGENGAMLTGWQKIDGKWYYLESAMKTGWIQDGGKWYYLNSCMQTGWQYINNNWYYLDSYMKTGWQKVNNRWYYMHDNGAMASSEWIKTNNKWYYVDNNGAMKTSGIIDGWKITSDGSAVKVK